MPLPFLKPIDHAINRLYSRGLHPNCNLNHRHYYSAYAIDCEFNKSQSNCSCNSQNCFHLNACRNFIKHAFHNQTGLRVFLTWLKTSTFLPSNLESDNHSYQSIGPGNQLTNPSLVLTFANCLINQS